MGDKKNKSGNSPLQDILYNLKGMDILSNDDMSQTYGGTSNHMNNDRDDGNISDDVPL